MPEAFLFVERFMGDGSPAPQSLTLRFNLRRNGETMIKEANNYYALSCPVCGRPLRISQQHDGKRVICQHCRGQFTARDSYSESESRNRQIDQALVRANRFLAASSGRSRGEYPSNSCHKLGDPSSPIPGRLTRPPRCSIPAEERAKSQAGQESSDQPRQSVLIVEYRDAVFDRLASTFRLIGMRILRAMCGFEAMGQYMRMRPNLVVANIDIPGQSGWLLTAKLRLLEATPHVWLYTSRKTAASVSMAKFVKAEEMFELGGDLNRLTDTILGCLAGAFPTVWKLEEPWIATVPRAS